MWSSQGQGAPWLCQAVSAGDICTRQGLYQTSSQVAGAIEGRSSFLKKRSKRLVFAVADLSGSVHQGMKSLLVHFFRKELLCLP
jgi:hypothetical protein